MMDQVLLKPGIAVEALKLARDLVEAISLDGESGTISIDTLKKSDQLRKALIGMGVMG